MKRRKGKYPTPFPASTGPSPSTFIVIDDGRGGRHYGRMFAGDDTPFGNGERLTEEGERPATYRVRCVRRSSRCTERNRRRSFWRSTTSDQTPSEGDEERTYTRESRVSQADVSAAPTPVGKIKRGCVVAFRR